jgi:GrpB-like predicted nucleotidyltransferase (UPF0157 family)
MLGFPMRVEVVPHDPAWKHAFEVETARIANVLGDVFVSAHHIGSTAIPGIVAKPVIDILLEVDDVARLDTRTHALKQLGYEAKGEFGIPGRRYFRKDDASGARTHQVHAFQAGNPELERHLAFRDYMIAHPDEARAYGALKKQLATAHPDDIEAYMDGKDSYIKEQERKALGWSARRGEIGRTEPAG